MDRGTAALVRDVPEFDFSRVGKQFGRQVGQRAHAGGPVGDGVGRSTGRFDHIGLPLVLHVFEAEGHRVHARRTGVDAESTGFAEDEAVSDVEVMPVIL